MGAYLNALREEGTKEDVLAELERMIDERDEANAKLAAKGEVDRMERRDAFAAFALTAIISSEHHDDAPKVAAVSAYQYADAMLTARDERPDDSPTPATER